ncbi:hypothetical protein DYB32_010728, partial [Aphanomyces invadans]
VINASQVQEYADLGVGSYLNAPFLRPKDNRVNWNTTEYRDTISKIQAMHTKSGLKIPMLYGLDSVHGANYVQRAVIFPHSINTGATFNATIARMGGLYTGRDTKAAGIPWVFGPMMEPARHKHWSRIYESFNEDPMVVSVLSSAFIQGMQSQKVGACVKHLIAYSNPIDGNDRSNVNASSYELLNYYVPPFKAAVDVGVLSVMGSYIALNGIPVAANELTSKDLLRHDLGFKGMLVSDYGEMYLLRRDHKIVTTDLDAVDLSLNKTSYDMSMTPWDTSFIKWGKQLLAQKRLTTDRLKESVTRILKLKLQLDLWNDPVPGADVAALVGDAASRAAALAAAQESIVLLKNQDNILPLAADAPNKLFLTGPSMDDVGYLCGGWSLYWQGTSGNDMFPNGISIRKAVESAVGGNGSTIPFVSGVEMESGNVTSPENFAKAKAYATAAAYTIVALGERTYAEDGGNKDPQALPAGFTTYVEALAATGTKIILVLTEGRPRLLGKLPKLASAVLWAGLPCELGGQAIADVLFGKVNPSGKMPYTYPQTDSFVNLASPYYMRNGTHCISNVYNNVSECPTEYYYGEGLSYTTFEYSGMALSDKSMTYAAGKANALTVSVSVKNSGAVAGQETVLLFMTPPQTRPTAETKLLKKYKKIWLAPGESLVVKFELRPEDWGYYSNEIGAGLAKSVPSGTYTVFFKGNTDCVSTPTNSLCQPFEWIMTGSGVLPKEELSRAKSASTGLALSMLAVFVACCLW